MRRILPVATLAALPCLGASAADTLLAEMVPFGGRQQWAADVLLPGHVTATAVLVVVRERGVDARLSVAGDGSRAASVEVDSPVDRSGLLVVALPVLPSRGAQLHVRVLAEEPSAYHGVIEVEVHPITAADVQARRVFDAWIQFTAAGENYARANAVRLSGSTSQEDVAKLVRAAAESYAAAAALARESGDRSLVAQATLHQAFIVYSELADYARGIALADEAAALLRETRDGYGAARATSLGASARRDAAAASRRGAITVAMPKEIAAQFAAAESMFRSVEQYHNAQQQRYERAQAINNVGLTYSLQGRYDEALAQYARAVELFTQIDHTSNAARSIQNSALVQFELGNHRACAATFAAALRTLERDDDRQLYGDILNNAALCLHVKGEFDRALNYYEQAFRVQTQLQNPLQTARTLHGMASTYYSMGDRDTALDLYRQALVRRPPGTDSRGRAATLSAMGNISCASARFADAIGYYSEALSSTLSPVVSRRIQLRLARCLTLDDRLGEALVYLSEVERSLAGGDNVASGLLQLEQGRVALAQKDWTKARLKLEAALPLLAKYEFIEEQSEALALLGSGAAAMGSPELAMQYADEGIRLAEQIRGRSRNPELRATLFAPWRKFYDLKIALLLRPYGDEYPAAVPPEVSRLAMRAAEQARFRALEEIQREPDGSIDSASERERQQLLLELTQKRAQVATRLERSGAEDERTQRLLRDIAGLRTRLDTLAVNATPALNGASPRTAIEPLRVAIPEDTAVVSYWMGEQDAAAWVQTRQGVQVYRLGEARRVRSAAEQAHATIAALGKSSQAVDATLREASDMLLAPLTQLRDKRRWIIVADGPLHSLPFSALPLPGFAVPVIARHELAMAPALRLIHARGSAPGRISSALLVADPVFDTSDERLPRDAAATGSVGAGAVSLSFPRLKATSTEISRIERHLAGVRIKQLVGFEAGRDELLASLQTPVDLLHVATHSRVDPDFPQLSAIVLSRFDKAGRERVPWLYAADLRSLPLTGTYVVISACESAVGKRIEGEGPIGLSYALLGAGARGVVATTWRVADAATAAYMDAFYDSLRVQADLPRAAAFAARRMMQDRRWSHPRHWAAFVALESEM